MTSSINNPDTIGNLKSEPLHIHYISYGIVKTGGYRHERFLYEAVLEYCSGNRETSGRLFRKHKLFQNVFEYLELILWSFLRSDGNINIVTARSGLSAIMRNWFTRNEVWIVMHNFDEADGKSKLLATYYRWLFYFLRRSRHTRFKVIVVSPFFLNYFKTELGIENTYYYPNLFDTEIYGPYSMNMKKKWIHLGQLSSKNDPEVFSLAGQLSNEGYYCYFSTLNKDESQPHNGKFEIKHFPHFNDYLLHMSCCRCTLALTRINEGWPRLAHESLLVGTPVIGYANGGLGDLLRESHSTIVKDITEAFEKITTCDLNSPYPSFIEKYSIKYAGKYLDAICNNR